VCLETVRRVKAEFPEIHIACGLSNISFGLPARKYINQAFLIAMMVAGMDGAILDPLDKKLMAFLYAADSLLGNDEYCLNYIEKYRDGAFEI
jgi:5-methyltetrahydrofolate--homocysteine methyltransferase